VQEIGLERQLSGQEHWLLTGRLLVQSPYQYGRAQPPVTPVPEISNVFFWPLWAQHTHGTQTNMEARHHAHKKFSSKKKKKKKKKTSQAVVTHAFNPSTWEAEAGRFLSLRPAWSTE
jgi:hypothetical protein